METCRGNSDGPGSTGKGTETRMDYEQYLYGRTARDASHRRPLAPRHGRIGSLAVGAAVALGIVAGIVALGGAKDAGRAEAPPASGSAPGMAEGPAMAVTLAASDGAVPQSRR
jgi:hypothetical protein